MKDPGNIKTFLDSIKIYVISRFSFTGKYLSSK